MQPVLTALALVLAHVPATDVAGTDSEPYAVETLTSAVSSPDSAEPVDGSQATKANAPGVVVMAEQSVAVRHAEAATAPEQLHGPPLPPLSVSEAKRLLKRPRGTLSHGRTNDGELVNARRIRMRGAGYAFFDHIKERETHFGTYEMKRFIERSGIRFRKEHRWAAIGIGNVSVEEGGKTRWHASHQSGRDIDIAMFGKDKRGRHVNPRNFTKYNSALESPSGLTFDVPRNTDLIRVLLTDPEYQVQWIFAARWLKRRIIANAKKRGFDPLLVTKMEKVMKQPGDSAPHDDHFHLRLYCAVEDRLHGCIERGPVWDWVDLGDAVFEAQVDNLERILEMPQTSYRLKAMERLRIIRAHSAVPALLQQLDYSSGKVRRTALDVIASFRAQEAVDGLLNRVATTTSVGWAAALFRTALRVAGPRTSDIARAFLATPSAMLHPKVATADLAGFFTPVIRTLRHERDPSVVPGLIALLESQGEEVRELSRAALEDITSHTITVPQELDKAAAHTYLVAAWRALWAAHQEQPWVDWTRTGLITAGYELPGELQEAESIQALVEATGDKRGHISRNAVRLLGVVTGHVIDPSAKSAKRQRKYWRRWWKRQQAKTSGAN
ncbi:MAG: penicillin-insensitive murein endopeptidase [Myxococcota bacterium]